MENNKLKSQERNNTILNMFNRKLPNTDFLISNTKNLSPENETKMVIDSIEKTPTTTNSQLEVKSNDNEVIINQNKKLKAIEEEDSKIIETSISKRDDSEDKHKDSKKELKDINDEFEEFKRQLEESEKIEAARKKEEQAKKILIDPILLKQRKGLWTSKYSPFHSSQIVGNSGNVNKLKVWLKFWEANNNLGQFIPLEEDAHLFKAILISGPPGIGKTTTAKLVCKEEGFYIYEQNSSDQRNKSIIQQTVGYLMHNKTLNGINNSKDQLVCKQSDKNVIIMDEMDGMSGNEDKGGISALISIIKSTKMPIILICNDRYNSKLNSLSKHCYELKYSKPDKNSILIFINSICAKENLILKREQLIEIVESSNYDIRQCLNQLEMVSIKQKIKVEGIVFDQKSFNKDKNLSITPLEAAKIFLNKFEVRFYLSIQN